VESDEPETPLMQFNNELEALLHRSGHEYDLTYGEIIGALEYKKLQLFAQSQKLLRISDLELE
jgi:hypothetical protein